MRQLFYYKMRQKFITKCDSFIRKCDSYYKIRRFFYKLRQLLKNATFITNCDSTYTNMITCVKPLILRSPIKCLFYYVAVLLERFHIGTETRHDASW